MTNSAGERNSEGSPRREPDPEGGAVGQRFARNGVFCLLIGVVLLGWEWSSSHRLRATGGAWGLDGGFSRIDVILLVLGWVSSLLGLRMLISGDRGLQDVRRTKEALVGVVLGLLTAYWLGAYRGLSVDLLVEWAPLFLVLGLLVALLRWAKPPDS